MDGQTPHTYTDMQDMSAAMMGRAVLQVGIHGWAVQNNIPEIGIPALPEQKLFLPFFIRLFHRPDWQEKTQAIVQTGLESDRMDAQSQDLFRRMLIAPGTQHFIVEALADLSGR